MLLKLLFNFIYSYGVVPDEFGKGLIIPLLKDTNSDASVCDNYRGISLSSAISKLFEYALLSKYSSGLTTDSLQFGFKNGVGCSDALFTVKSTVAEASIWFQHWGGRLKKNRVQCGENILG